MPFVNIKITRDMVSAGQKALLIQGVTDLLRDVLGKKPATSTRWTRTTGASAGKA